MFIFLCLFRFMYIYVCVHFCVCLYGSVHSFFLPLCFYPDICLCKHLERRWLLVLHKSPPKSAIKPALKPAKRKAKKATGKSARLTLVRYPWKYLKVKCFPLSCKYMRTWTSERDQCLWICADMHAYLKYAYVYIYIYW